MDRIEVKASRDYEVLVGRGILPDCGRLAREVLPGRSVVVVSDGNVAPLYLGTVKTSLTNAGLTVSEFVIPAGESSKNTAELVELLEFAASRGLDRHDAFVALGGGVVGDLTAFAASVYLRGVNVISIPTSLLADVDSSVGGKTAVDLKAGKNLAGTFWQPSLVICDIDALRTLPREIYNDGCAEVIKYGLLFDRDFFEFAGDPGIRSDEEMVVSRCVRMKRDIVRQDERDTGRRAMLNLGHTFAHTIESASGYTVSHGRAVAAGLVMAARVSAGIGLCGAALPEDISRVLALYSLPDRPGFPADVLSPFALRDKKRSGNKITLILPRRAGECIAYDADVADIPRLFRTACGED